MCHRTGLFSISNGVRKNFHWQLYLSEDSMFPIGPKEKKKIYFMYVKIRDGNSRPDSITVN